MKTTFYFNSMDTQRNENQKKRIKKAFLELLVNLLYELAFVNNKT